MPGVERKEGGLTARQKAFSFCWPKRRDSAEKVRLPQEYFNSSNPNPSYCLDTHSKQQKEACLNTDGAQKRMAKKKKEKSPTTNIHILLCQRASESLKGWPFPIFATGVLGPKQKGKERWEFLCMGSGMWSRVTGD